MIVHTVTQGTTEWLRLRAGIPTASCFDQLLTPTGKLSTQSKGYMHRLLAERMLGRPLVEAAVTSWMVRGSELEAEAVTWYEAQRDCDTARVGFVTDDGGTVGASPDRLVGADGLLEVKCPKESVHVGYLLSESVGDAYRLQVQGQLWVCERRWVDVVSYSPELPTALIRVERDEAFIEMLAAAVATFSFALETHAAALRDRGWIHPKETNHAQDPT